MITAVIAVLSLLATISITGCSLFQSDGDAPAFREIGAGVSVDTSAPDGLKAVVDETTRTPFVEAIQPLGPMVDITPGGPQTDPVELQYKLDNAPDRGETVIFATSETGAPNSWTLQPADKVSLDGQYAYLTVKHFSRYQGFMTKLANTVNGAKTVLGQIVNGFTGDAIAEAQAPVCTDTAKAQNQGYLVNSDGDALLWCFGIENEEPIIKVVNQRRYALLFEHTGLTAVQQPPMQADLSALARWSAGENRIVLFPREEYVFTIDLQPGHAVRLNAEYDGVAQAMYQLQIGLWTAINGLARFGAPTVKPAAQLLNDLLDLGGCATTVSDPPDLDRMIHGCFTDEALTKVFGKGASAILSPAMLFGGFIEYFHNQVNVFGDLWNGRNRHVLVISRSKPAQSQPQPRQAACPNNETLTSLYERGYPGPAVTVVGLSRVTCSGGWVAAIVDAADVNAPDNVNSYPGLFRASGGGWVYTDRSESCAAGTLPAKVAWICTGS